MHPDDMHSDLDEYFKFTGPYRLEKAIHVLQGIVAGITSDRRINDLELAAIHRWLGDHLEFAHRHPFNELVPTMQAAVSDGILDEEERRDILWLCDQLTPRGLYMAAITSDIRRLHGFLGGVVADRKIDATELRELQAWIHEHEHLRCCYPYDEIESILLHVPSDGIVDAEEHAALVHFFDQFVDKASHHSVAPENTLPASNLTFQGVCATCPEIVFSEKLFCFTGTSKRAKKRDMEARVVTLGGRVSKNVVKDLHYLVIGADGNPCWAYSCYGRKVEAAVEHRKAGLPLVIVHEHDYWDALADAGVA